MQRPPGDLPADTRARIADIIAELIELPPTERRARLNTLCSDAPEVRAEIESLLAAHDASGSFLEPAPERMLGLIAATAEYSLEGTRLGAYSVIRPLGRGGMSDVYLAERRDGQFEHRVALKVVRAPESAPIRQRFARERRILARLEHPGIARLLDGGVTPDGRPYIIMEYVEGVTLTEYCAHQQLAINDRLRLFLQVCEAVAYAHRNLVVHRDLKPGNILVTSDGRVRLLDFGIAKLIEPDTTENATLTDLGVHVLTPDYAAPEQVYGEPITTATDVYSLGVVLYELLSGQRPRRFSGRRLAEMARAFRDSAPTPPGSLKPELRGDLDAIVLTAIRREPERRYPSVLALYDDVSRHLNGLPVLARRDSFPYRLSRLIRRNRAAAAASIIAFGALMAGLVGIAWQGQRAERERDIALNEADKAARVATFMTSLFQLANPAQSGGDSITVRDMLDSGRVWIDRELTGQPELRSQLMFRLGEAYFGLGRYDRARDLWQATLNTQISLYGESHGEVATTMHYLAKVLNDLGSTDSAEVLARRSLAILRLRRNPSDLATARFLDRLANSLRIQGRIDEAESLAREALTILPDTQPDARNDRSIISTTLAHLLRARGEYAAAESLHREVLGLRRTHWGNDHPEVANTLINLANVVGYQERFVEAESLFQAGLAMRRALQGEDHAEIGIDMAALAELYRRNGKLVQAEATYRDALQRQRSSLSSSARRIPGTLLGLAQLLLAQNRRAEAERLLREAVALARSRGEEESAAATEAKNVLAELQRRPPQRP